jgi:hypothetical protein
MSDAELLNRIRNTPRITVLAADEACRPISDAGDWYESMLTYL